MFCYYRILIFMLWLYQCIMYGKWKCLLREVPQLSEYPYSSTNKPCILYLLCLLAHALRKAGDIYLGESVCCACFRTITFLNIFRFRPNLVNICMYLRSTPTLTANIIRAYLCILLRSDECHSLLVYKYFPILTELVEHMYFLK